jgi:hypothetical protein
MIATSQKYDTTSLGFYENIYSESRRFITIISPSTIAEIKELYWEWLFIILTIVNRYKAELSGVTTNRIMEDNDYG